MMNLFCFSVVIFSFKFHRNWRKDRNVEGDVIYEKKDGVLECRTVGKPQKVVIKKVDEDSNILNESGPDEFQDSEADEIHTKKRTFC